MNVLPRSWRRSIHAFLAAGCFVLGSLQAQAADFTVTNVNDSGAGSLRSAIDQANATGGSNTISFATTGTITLTTPLTPISNNLSINGPGTSALTINGNNANRIFYVESGTVSISQLNLINGTARGGAGGNGNATPEGSSGGGGGGGLGAGGAVFVGEQANLTLRGVSFGNNRAIGGTGGQVINGPGGGGGGGGLGGNGGSQAGGGGGLYAAGGSVTGGGGGQFGAGGSASGGGGGQFGPGGSGSGGGGGQFGPGGTNFGGGGGQFGPGGSGSGGGGGQFGAGGSNSGGGGGQSTNGGSIAGGGGGSIGNGTNGTQISGVLVTAGNGGPAPGTGGNGIVTGTASSGGPNGGGGGAGDGSQNPGIGGNGGVNGGGGGGSTSGGHGGVNGGGGGGGVLFDSNGNGGNGGANGGGGAGQVNGGSGGTNGGGGAGGINNNFNNTTGNGGNGGANGGGGSSGTGSGGNGGKNGGGGGGLSTGGNGGINGGGGGSETSVGGSGGFGGGGGGSGFGPGSGQGTRISNGGAGGFGAGNGGGSGQLGGGGSAFGGALFVKQGGTLTIIDSDLPTGNSVTAGAGATNGAADGTGIYLHDTNLVYQGSGTSSVADQIAGTGGVTKTGAGTLNLSGNHTYTGTTTIDQGLLALNGQIAGPVVVNQGGTLGGNGQVGPTTVNGVITPGSSGSEVVVNGVHIGTTVIASGGSFGKLLVNGNYVQNSGSAYQVKIDAGGQSDLIQVKGVAQINGGIVQVLASNGIYQQNQAYTILTTTAGVTGTFDSAIGNIPGYYRGVPVYGANDVQLVLASNFAGVATTFNQLSIARYIDQQTAAGNISPALESNLRSLAPDQLAGALDQLAGSSFASLQTVGRLRALFLHQLLADQIRPSFGSPIGSARGQAADSDESTSGFWRGVRGWSRLYGQAGHVVDDNGAGDFNYRFSGFQAGLDQQVCDGLRVGVTGMYNYTSVDFPALISTAQGSGGYLGGYGVQTFGDAYLLAVATYGFNRFSVNRLLAFGDVTTVATSKPQQYDFNGLLEAGYNQRCGNWFLQPLIGLQEYSLYQSTAGELAQQGVGLVVPGQYANAIWFSTGLRVSRPIQDANNYVVPTLHARWVQDWRGESQFASGALAGAGGSYLIQGATAGRNFLVAGIGIRANAGGCVNLVADYTLQTSGPQTSHTGSGGIEIRW